MNKQRINELGSEIKRVQVEITEKAMKGRDYSEEQTQFNSSLLQLINLSLDSDDTMEKLFKLLERK